MSERSYFPGWSVVIGSGVGIAFGSVPFFAAGFALLAGAMARRFGWTQPDVAKAASIYLFMQMLAYPLCGAPLDRWGSRRFAMLSIALFAVSLVLLSQVGASLTQLYLAFAFMGFISAGTNVVSYARAIALWFNRKRGFALGLAASAQAVGSFLIPVLAHRLIDTYGWSFSLIVFAAFELAVCLPLVGFLIKDSPKPYGLLPDGDREPVRMVPTQAANDGMPVSAIVRTAMFWKLAISFAVMGMTFYAVAPNIVYILTKKAGMSIGDVAMIQAVSGIAVLFGRIGFGYLLDRIHAPIVGMIALALTAICAATYSLTAMPALIVIATILNGLAIGGDTDLMPYLASRYFGTIAVSRIFGWFLFAFFLGAAVGPVAFAQLSASFGGADTPLLMLVAIQIVPAALLLSMGRYRVAPPGDAKLDGAAAITH
ncbi:MFS family permease [Bradyrhizobium sp. F1.4.3]|uniref:MFS transporter n=1 Tax=Bradyrhizobium sp. F1.4.3 TaxID=3156356 RepID=UPI0033941AC6